MSLSLVTLALILRNILQNCGWLIHHKEWILISTRDHHRSPFSLHCKLPPTHSLALSHLA